MLDVLKPGSADGYLFEEKGALIGGKTAKALTSLMLRRCIS